LSNAQAARLLDDIGKVDLLGATLELTAKERGVLQLAAAGITEERMADLLDLSPETIKTRSKIVRRKLGAKSTTEAVAIAMREGLIA